MPGALGRRLKAAPLYFADAAAFRAWLNEHAATANELIVGFHKIGSGLPSMSWSEAVDEALCVGWIDGVRKRVDDERYQIRFTPRRPGSIWSAVNIAKIERLQAEGRLQAAGLAAYARRRAERSKVYAFEQQQMAELSAAELRAFRAEPAAWAFFEATPPSYRKVVLHWIVTAKRSETRDRRFAQLLAACAAGERLR